MGMQEIGIPSRFIGTDEVRNAQPFNTSINGITDEHSDPAPTFGSEIGCKLFKKSIANVYSPCRINFTCDAILAEMPNFMNMGISPVHTSDELGSFKNPTTRIGRAINEPNCLLPGHLIGEVAANRIIRARSEQNYSSKTNFEMRGGNQDFGCQNNSMS